MDRYNLYTEAGSVTNMLLHDSGKWVRYEDTAARIAELEAQLAAAQERATEQQRIIDRLVAAAQGRKE